MDILIWFVIGAFATYRCSVMVAQEEGPFRLFELFRNLFTTPNWIGRGVRCPLCLSFWFGLILGALMVYGLVLPLVDYPLIALGLSGVAVWLYKKEQ